MFRPKYRQAVSKHHKIERLTIKDNSFGIAEKRFPQYMRIKYDCYWWYTYFKKFLEFTWFRLLCVVWWVHIKTVPSCFYLCTNLILFKIWLKIYDKTISKSGNFNWLRLYLNLNPDCLTPLQKCHLSNNIMVTFKFIT